MRSVFLFFILSIQLSAPLFVISVASPAVAFAQGEGEDGYSGGGLLGRFIDWIFSGMKRWFCWLLLWCLGVGQWMLGGVMAVVPAAPSFWPMLLDWFGMFSMWFPVGTALTAGTSLLALEVALIGVRWVKTWIPTLSV